MKADSIVGVSGVEEDMTEEQSEDFRKVLEGYLRGRVHSATYNLERKVVGDRVKVYAELHLEVSDYR